MSQKKTTYRKGERVLVEILYNLDERGDLVPVRNTEFTVERDGGDFVFVYPRPSITKYTGFEKKVVRRIR